MRKTCLRVHLINLDTNLAPCLSFEVSGVKTIKMMIPFISKFKELKHFSDCADVLNHLHLYFVVLMRRLKQYKQCICKR